MNQPSSYRPKVQLPASLPGMVQRVASPNPFLPTLSMFKHQPDPVRVALSLGGDQEMLAQAMSKKSE